MDCRRLFGTFWWLFHTATLISLPHWPGSIACWMRNHRSTSDHESCCITITHRPRARDPKTEKFNENAWSRKERRQREWDKKKRKQHTEGMIINLSNTGDRKVDAEIQTDHTRTWQNMVGRQLKEVGMCEEKTMRNTKSTVRKMPAAKEALPVSDEFLQKFCSLSQCWYTIKRSQSQQRQLIRMNCIL